MVRPSYMDFVSLIFSHKLIPLNLSSFSSHKIQMRHISGLPLYTGGSPVTGCRDDRILVLLGWGWGLHQAAPEIRRFEHQKPDPTPEGSPRFCWRPAHRWKDHLYLGAFCGGDGKQDSWVPPHPATLWQLAPLCPLYRYVSCLVHNVVNLPFNSKRLKPILL